MEHSPNPGYLVFAKNQLLDKNKIKITDQDSALPVKLPAPVLAMQVPGMSSKPDEYGLQLFSYGIEYGKPIQMANQSTTAGASGNLQSAGLTCIVKPGVYHVTLNKMLVVKDALFDFVGAININANGEPDPHTGICLLKAKLKSLKAIYEIDGSEESERLFNRYGSQNPVNAPIYKAEFVGDILVTVSWPDGKLAYSSRYNFANPSENA